MRFGTALGVLLAASAAGACRGESPPTLAEALAESASLRGVTFLDPDHGWAVGDHGALLRTTDGGRHWRPVAPPTDLPLAAVSFVDPQRGWAVGGALEPYTHRSKGLVLATENGGRDWETLGAGATPRLRAVRMFDAKSGVAAGDGTPASPAGVHATDDGGRHWRPVPGAAERRWLAAAFVRDPLGEVAGVLAGVRGVSGRLVGRRIDLSSGAADLRAARGVALLDASHGWLAGDAGLVRTTNDGGLSWSPPPVEPPEAFTDRFDWNTVAARGRSVWLAGSPGSVVLASHDGGNSWLAAETRSSAPITAITFVDDRRGWAVGEFGVVLATEDAGASWQVQRGAGRRAAALVLLDRPESLPTELIAEAAAAEGYRTVVAAPMLPAGHAEAADALERLADAATRVGSDAARGGWSPPLSPLDAELPAGLLAERLDRLTDGRSAELLAAEVRRLLEAYRPEVVVTPRPDGGIADLLAAAVGDATAAAQNEPSAWCPKRVLALATDDRTPLSAGESRAATGDFVAELGDTPAQWRRDARGLLADDYRVAPAAYRWSTLAGTPGYGGARANLFAGLSLERGGDARRPFAAADADRLDLLRRLASKRRNMERLLDRSAGDPAWAGQVVNLTGGLEAEAGAELLRQLADGYRAAGRREAAAQTLYLLARRYPDSPLADAGLLWLVAYYASGECGWSDHHGQGTDARGPTLANVAAVEGGPGLAAPDEPGVLTSAQRLERAAALIDFLSQARPELAAQPGLRTLDAAVQRARGFGAEAEKLALVLSKQSIADPWRRAAEAERWLAKPDGLPPEKPVTSCRYTPRRPLLDGRMDDQVWATADAVPLMEPGATRPTATVRLAHDDAFLFVAIEAQAAAPPANDSEPRARDADLASADRVELRIDVDRDYATGFALTIDSRGRTHDSLWGDPHWTPTWYVAADADASAWRVELAVPLAELADPEALARAAWAVSLRRSVPAAAGAAWPVTEAAPDSPDAWGLLLFD